MTRSLVLRDKAGSIVACANITAESPSANQTFPKVANFSRSDDFYFEMTHIKLPVGAITKLLEQRS